MQVKMLDSRRILSNTIFCVRMFPGRLPLGRVQMTSTFCIMAHLWEIIIFIAPRARGTEPVLIRRGT
uniref:Uncharacterized protein n=1 Tax=Nelumbo nucifera TaxID=4432 RepID=A0A822YA80_NELNU|nr:TPA_asm: hypothetical protein HUJ06_009845 [Nelumbo nucifera]DAD31000.1 TPA_asm: hypothetical protein HUJ06_009851 [Nelumbo nucifera]